MTRPSADSAGTRPRSRPAIARRAVARAASRIAREDRAAGALWFALIAGVFVMMGAIAIDLGRVLVLRGEAQRTADAMALAGVAELPGEPALAAAYAREWAVRNGADLDDIVRVTVDASCWRTHPADDPWVPDAVAVDISRSAAMPFLSGLGVSVDVGAHAKACIGSQRAASGLRPWAIEAFHSPCFELRPGGNAHDVYDYVALYGQQCPIRLASPSSQTGSIRLGDAPGDPCGERGGGAAKYARNIVEGAGATCTIGNVIESEPGLKVGPTFSAIQALLAGDGMCDAALGNRNGVDELDEVLTTHPAGAPPSPTTRFFPRDCGGDGDPATADSPRVITVAVIAEFNRPTGGASAAIVSFAGFFVDGCAVVNGAGHTTAFYPDCDVRGSARTKTQLVGTFIQLQEAAAGPIGPPAAFSTHVYRLGE